MNKTEARGRLRIVRATLQDVRDELRTIGKAALPETDEWTQRRSAQEHIEAALAAIQQELARQGGRER